MVEKVRGGKKWDEENWRRKEMEEGRRKKEEKGGGGRSRMEGMVGDDDNFLKNIIKKFQI